MKFAFTMAFTSIPDMIILAQEADKHGWDCVSVADHVVHPETLSNPYPYTKDGSRRWEAFTDWADPWVVIAAMAAVTENIRFSQSIFVLPLRNPFLAAKAISTAAVIAKGRVQLSVGVGWSQDEFALMGQDFKSRGKRCDEMIEVMRKLWTGEMVSHDGVYYQFDRLEMNPKPPGYIPLWTGGFSAPAIDRASRLADGWLSDAQTSDEIVQIVDRIQERRLEYGRKDLPFDVMASPSDAFDIEGYRYLEERGVTHILTMPWALYYGMTDSLEEKVEGVRRFAKEVIANYPG